MDVAFIIDNTTSVGEEPLTQLENTIGFVLDDIEAASGGDYRLAIVTPDDDQVHVRLNFSANNRTDFETELNLITLPLNGGNGPPESTDECLNTVLNSLAASGRVNPRVCYPPSSELQINDFTFGFRPSAQKRVVMITDHEPGGFCDVGDSGAQAAIYASQARANCVKINAVRIGAYADAIPIMLNYYQTSCGWYEEIPAAGSGIAEAVVRMLYVPGYCNCP